MFINSVSGITNPNFTYISLFHSCLLYYSLHIDYILTKKELGKQNEKQPRFGRNKNYRKTSHRNRNTTTKTVIESTKIKCSDARELTWVCAHILILSPSCFNRKKTNISLLLFIVFYSNCYNPCENSVSCKYEDAEQRKKRASIHRQRYAQQ